MSNTVWSADKGWHDGPEVKVTLDEHGRVKSEPIGRYRLLQADITAMRQEGEKLGERTSLDAQRLGMGYDSFPGIDYSTEQVRYALWHRDVDADAVGDLSICVLAFIDGYRDGYEQAWEEDDDQ